MAVALGGAHYLASLRPGPSRGGTTLIDAIAPRAAAQLAMRLADETDSRVASLPLALLWPNNATSPLNPFRANHRAEHLDEIEAALGGPG